MTPKYREEVSKALLSECSRGTLISAQRCMFNITACFRQECLRLVYSYSAVFLFREALYITIKLYVQYTISC